MFRSKIVFILGAGASAEVGLPLGDKLKRIIADKIDIRFNPPDRSPISGDYQIINALRDHTKIPNLQRNDRIQGDINPYLKAAWRLRDALPQAISIDNLLDTYRDDKLSEICGKLGIVASILEEERSSKIYIKPFESKQINFDSLSETWFAGFVKILTENIPRHDVEKIFDNVSIINFNYDRCIEHYLHESLKNYYSLEADIATSLMEKLKIFHPYGSVGKLPWQDKNSSLQVTYGSENADILNLAQQIKTFNETEHDTEELNQIHEIIQQTEIIVFLGFAFHRQNLELLAPNTACKAKRIYATAVGISNSDCSVIKDELERLLKQRQQKVRATIDLRNDLKCGEIFNEYWRSFTAGM